VARKTITVVGDWQKTDRLLSTLDATAKHNLKVALKGCAELMRREIRKKLKHGDEKWADLAPVTARRKGKDSPLFDSGQLRDAITVLLFGKNIWWVGIPETAKNRNGVSLAMIGNVLEHGKLIKPRRVKHLIIPVTRQAAKLARTYGGALKIPGLFRPRGKNVLVKKVGKAGLRVLFILVKKIRIPKRSFIESTFKEQKNKIVDRIDAALVAATKGVRIG
jgi:hypothetical protein